LSTHIVRLHAAVQLVPGSDNGDVGDAQLIKHLWASQKQGSLCKTVQWGLRHPEHTQAECCANNFPCKRDSPARKEQCLPCPAVANSLTLRCTCSTCLRPRLHHPLTLSTASHCAAALGWLMSTTCSSTPASRISSRVALSGEDRGGCVSKTTAHVNSCQQSDYIPTAKVISHFLESVVITPRWTLLVGGGCHDRHKVRALVLSHVKVGDLIQRTATIGLADTYLKAATSSVGSFWMNPTVSVSSISRLPLSLQAGGACPEASINEDDSPGVAHTAASTLVEQLWQKLNSRDVSFHVSCL
jgi:hypothetical protein